MSFSNTAAVDNDNGSSPARHTGRKPANLQYAGGKSPRQLIWEKIREMKRFEIGDLIRSLPGTIHRNSIRSYIKALWNGGFLSKDGDQYRLVNDNGVEAPRVTKEGKPVTQGRKQENLWRTLRTIGHPVGFFELSALASTEEHQITPAFAKDYLNNLNNAGYLNKDGEKYRLKPSMNTGPRPPMIQRVRSVYDPNLGRVVWTETQGDDDE